MKRAKDLIVLDESLSQYAGQPAWEGIAWVRDGDQPEEPLSADIRERNRKAYRSALPTRYREYTFEALREHAGNCDAVRACHSIEPGSNLFLHGQPGNGKTHLAVATGFRLVGPFTVRFWSVARLFSTLRAAAGGQAEKPNLHQPDVLILDDLGKVKATEFVYQEIYDTLEGRWADARTTIFTANHRPSECARQLSPDDEAAAGAILSRLASGVVVEVKGADERLTR